VSRPAQPNNILWRFYYEDADRVSRRWILTLFAMFTLFPGVGSGGSILFVGVWLFALPYWLLDPEERRLIAREKTLVATCVAYFLIMAGFAVGHAVVDGGIQDFGAVYSNLPFLLVAPVFPVLRRAARDNWLPMVFPALPAARCWRP